MIKTIKHLIKIKAANQVNAFIYFFKRIWLIGKILPDTVYQETLLKTIVTVFASMWKLSYKYFKMFLYIALVVVLPISYAMDYYSSLKGHGFSLFIWVYFFLSYIIGGFMNSRIFTVTNYKYISVKFMKLDPKKYVRADLFLNIIQWFILSTPVFIIAVVAYKEPLWYIPLLILTYMFTRLAIEGLLLVVYEKTGVVMTRHNLTSGFVIVPAFILAFITLPFGVALPIEGVLLHPITVILISIVGLFGAYYVFVGYNGYKTDYVRTINYEASKDVMKKEVRKMSFKDVAMKDEDSEQVVFGEFDHLKGYKYMNAIFFKRNHRQLLKGVMIRVAYLFMFGIALVGFYFVRQDDAITFSQGIYKKAGVFIFAMYLLVISNKATRSMFYNADISLLRYGFYRKPKAILENFRIRFTRVAFYNSLIAIAVIINLMIFQFVCGTPLWSIEAVTTYLVIFIGSLFFTVHHLFLYYVFQPYSTDLQVKNPFYIVLDSIIYIFSLVSLQSDVKGIGFAIFILSFTMIYSVVALFLVYRLAPKYFRVK